ncbi:MAG: LytTR family DNA-binding domain-containing protein [Bacteroidetes bacterium]|nr:LytTR family DNA-binding domain-containing protein [Bacteroidota bacterium]
MRVLIIEDEKPAAEHLANLVHRFDPQIDIKGTLDSVKKSVEWFMNHAHPDLVLMDIQLADGLSFEIFEKTEVKCPVIFTTAYNEYAIRAFKVNSVDYLLKPIDFDELSSAFHKFKLSFGDHGQEKYAQLFDQILNNFNNQHKKRFVIKIGEHIKSVPVEEIYYFYSLEKATFLNTADNHNYVIDYSLEQVESLVDPKSFFRINRKYLIQMEAIDDIITYSNSRLKIELKHSNDADAIVAREKVTSFKQWLDQ